MSAAVTILVARSGGDGVLSRIILILQVMEGAVIVIDSNKTRAIRYIIDTATPVVTKISCQIISVNPNPTS